MPVRDLEPILQAMLDAVVTIDGGGMIIGWNAVAEQVFGWTAAEAIGRSMSALIIPPAYRAAHEAGLRRFQETGEARVINRRIEIRALDRAGREFPVELAIVSASLGEQARFIGFLRDISAREDAKRRLQLSEESLRLATDAAEIGTWDWDLVTDVLTWSDRTRTMFGVDLDATLTIDDFYVGLHPEDRPAATAAFQAALDPQIRATYDVEYRAVGRKDGAIRWVAAKGRALFDADGRCVRAMGTAIDITGRKRAEDRDAFMLALSDALLGVDTDEALRAVSALLGRHFGVARTGYGNLDPIEDVFDYTVCWTDDSIPPLLGRYPARAFGEKIVARLSEGHTIVVDDLLAASISDETQTRATASAVDTRAILVVPFVREGRLRTIVYLNSREPRHWTPDEIRFMEEVAGRTREVIARAAAEAALRDLAGTLEQRVAERTLERNLFATIVEETDAIVHVLDRDYRWLAFNRAGADEFEELFGLRPRIGDSLLDRLSDWPAQRDTIVQLWSRAFAGETYTTVEAFGASPDALRTYEMKFNPLRDDHGAYVGGFQIVTDVTDRLRAAAELERTQDALRQSQKMEAIGQLTGGVAHDFNNLLTVIRSSADLLQRPGLTEEKRRRYIEAIIDTSDRAAKLTSQLLVFARRQALKPEPFDVGMRIDAVSDMLRTILGERITLSVEALCGRCAVEADTSQFDTALVNLAVNARDAMDGEGRLVIAIDTVADLEGADVAARPAFGHVKISVTDTGVGIDPDDLARIFEPFFTRKAVGKGTGLGLSQVYGFAKQSGGEVEVRSTPGEGATFTLYLPGADPARIDRPVQAAAPSLLPSKGRLLVVEDNDNVGEFVTQLLEELGYAVTLRRNAAEARLVLEAGEPVDLIFSDIVMPGISGIEFAREVRARWPALPIVLASGYSHAFAEGHPDFPLIRKPYSLDDLASILAQAFGAASA